EVSLHGINTSRKKRKVLPMSPVQFVTYLSARTLFENSPETFPFPLVAAASSSRPSCPCRLPFDAEERQRARIGTAVEVPERLAEGVVRSIRREEERQARTELDVVELAVTYKAGQKAKPV
ncbi:hypothetical protein NHF53_03355, partial [Ciceribacter sp. RN22]